MYLLESFYLLLQLGLTGAGLIFLQPGAGCAPSLCFSLQLVQLKMLQLFTQVFNELRNKNNKTEY